MADKIAGLLFKISADTKALQQNFKQVQKSTSIMQKSFSALGPIIAGAFSVRAIAGFTKEIIGLAGQAEGVIEAFSRLPESEKLIKDLTAATRGTVTQLNLMKYAVQAKNFKIPLEQLATYFEFATKRAAQTGESVERLVEQLILGIGRQSVQRLDDLGLSMKEIQAETKKLGDFGEAVGAIIRRELGSMGDVSVTAGQKLQSLSTVWEDIKIEIGTALINTEEFNTALSDVSKTISEIDWGKTITDIIYYARAIRMASSAIKDLLVPTRIIARQLDWEKIFGGKTKGETASQPSYQKTGIKAKPLPGVPVSTGLLGAGLAATAPETIETAFAKAPGLAPIQGMSFTGFATQLSAAATQLKTKTVPEIESAMMDLSIVMQQTFMGAVDAFGQGVENLFAGTAHLENFFDGILQAFGGFMSQMGKMIIAYGISMVAFKKAFSNPIAAIAAGAALVAIGSAISGLAKRGPMAGGAMGGGAAPASQTIQVVGKISGRDIALANKRGSALIGSIS